MTEMSSEISMVPPETLQFASPIAMSSLPKAARSSGVPTCRPPSQIWWPFGPNCAKSMPIFEAMNMSDTHTWVASPTKASLQSSILLPAGKFSIMVMRSPSSWVGWLYSLMPLITGAAEYLARSTTSLWRSTRAMRMSTSDPMTRPESSMDS